MIENQRQRSPCTDHRAGPHVTCWSASGKLISTRCARVNSLVLTAFIVVVLGILFASFQAEGQTRLAQNMDDSMLTSFMSALKKVDEVRKSSRLTVVELTPYFTEFYNSNKIEPYIAFFEGIGIPTLRDNSNQRHYIAFEIRHTKLWALYFTNFAREDRLVMVFTTSSEQSSDIMEFRANSSQRSAVLAPGACNAEHHISVEARSDSGTHHGFLLYDNGFEKQYVRAGNSAYAGDYWGGSGFLGTGTASGPGLGPIVVFKGLYELGTPDFALPQTLADWSKQNVISGDIDLSTTWTNIVRSMEAIDSARVLYDPVNVNPRNSNSAIMSALRDNGFDETPIVYAPGWNTFFNPRSRPSPTEAAFSIRYMPVDRRTRHCSPIIAPAQSTKIGRQHNQQR